MSSGIAVNPECVSVFQELKLQHKYKYIIYKLNETSTEIVVESLSEDADYNQFLENLPESDCRYAVYDFSYETEDAGKRSKIVFIAWSPDTARIRSKMVYSSSKEAIKNSLNGLAVLIQGTDISEVDYDCVLDKVSRGRA